MNETAELRNYAGAVAAGAYDQHQGGLVGKNDNVRRCWEDLANRQTLHGVLSKLVEDGRRRGARLRVLDLGCGAGEGYRIVAGVRDETCGLGDRERPVLPEWMLGSYRGVDLSQAMVEKARETYARHPKLHFDVADLREGLPVGADEAPYDLYFSSFGSLSHLADDALAGLIDGICGHMGRSAVLVTDMLGRYSREWPCYWDGPPTGEATMRPYSMSYLLPPEQRTPDLVETMSVRYWGAHELSEFVAERADRHGVVVADEQRRDRSVLVGRHMDTGEYNQQARPIRRAVSSLHEVNQRTNLRDLLCDFVPQPGHPAVNRFHAAFQMAWNTVVTACIEAVERPDREDLADLVGLADGQPPAVAEAIETLVGVVQHVGLFQMGDPRSNVIERQLGHALRRLEGQLQEGLGAAHGLLSVFTLTRG